MTLWLFLITKEETEHCSVSSFVKKMTTIKIDNNKIIVDDRNTGIVLSDFHLDSNVGNCSLVGLRNISKPILNKMFMNIKVYSYIKITTNECIYPLSGLILSLLSISSKIKLRVCVSSYDGNDVFHKLDHELILRLRYMTLFEALLDRVFRSKNNLIDYLLCDYCYYNIFLSKSPSCNICDSFFDYFDDILDGKMITKEYLSKMINKDNAIRLTMNDNGALVPSRLSIDRYGWVSGKFHDHFIFLRDIIRNNMDLKISNHLLGFDPSVDFNFKEIASEALIY